MLTLTPVLEEASSLPLYQQLFVHIRDSIIRGDIRPGEKLPSLRAISKDLDISITTSKLAYDQLLIEGYIKSKAKSGYFAVGIPSDMTGSVEASSRDGGTFQEFYQKIRPSGLKLDPKSFDFPKWKYCANKIFNEYSDHLLLEGDVQGELALRDEISAYIYQARGVRCTPDQIIIGAGTQQLINQLCILLNKTGIDHASFENPGYVPVRSIFSDRAFKLTFAPLDGEGINVDKLPANIPSTVYVSPSNQFPTGSIMSVARRYALLEWAYKNSSLIIEDDYNSELRYDSRPVPSLQGLDNKGHVVYLGSFSSSLFASIKISYMVLPEKLHQEFIESMRGYVQTCSKAEQLTLALYMNKGFYQTHLRKQRNLNARKIQAAAEGIMNYSKGKIEILNKSSGLHMLLQLKDKRKSAIDFCQIASQYGLSLAPMYGIDEDKDDDKLLFYYTKLPLADMEEATKKLGLLATSSKGS